jgi:hypothetical protein
MASTTAISSFRLEETSCPSSNLDTTRIHRMPAGAEIEPDGKVRFRVWAPAAETLDSPHPGDGGLFGIV